MAETSRTRLVSVAEILASRTLPLGRTAIYDAIRSGQIPSVRVGRRVLVPADLADRLAASAWERMGGDRAA